MNERYRAAVQELNTLKIAVDTRVKRCNYLKRGYETYKVINPEQAEAFVVRLHQHKPKLIDQLEKMEELEAQLRQMPKTKIMDK